MTSWTVAHQAPLSMGFPRQEFWSGLPFPPPGDLPDPEIEPKSPALAARLFINCCHLGRLDYRCKCKMQSYNMKIVKNLPANVGEMGSIPGSKRSPGEGNGNQLLYSCLGNLTDRGAW